MWSGSGFFFNSAIVIPALISPLADVASSASPKMSRCLPPKELAKKEQLDGMLGKTWAFTTLVWALKDLDL